MNVPEPLLVHLPSVVLPNTSPITFICALLLQMIELIPALTCGPGVIVMITVSVISRQPNVDVSVSETPPAVVSAVLKA